MTGTSVVVAVDTPTSRARPDPRWAGRAVWARRGASAIRRRPGFGSGRAMLGGGATGHHRPAALAVRFRTGVLRRRDHGGVKLAFDGSADPLRRAPRAVLDDAEHRRRLRRRGDLGAQRPLGGAGLLLPGRSHRRADGRVAPASGSRPPRERRPARSGPPRELRARPRLPARSRLRAAGSPRRADRRRGRNRRRARPRCSSPPRPGHSATPSALTPALGLPTGLREAPAGGVAHGGAVAPVERARVLPGRDALRRAAPRPPRARPRRTAAGRPPGGRGGLSRAGRAPAAPARRPPPGSAAAGSSARRARAARPAAGPAPPPGRRALSRATCA